MLILETNTYKQIKTYIKTDIKRYRYKDKGTQRHRRDTKAQEGEITHRHFRRIKGELTDLKDQKREITQRHFKRIKGELTDLNDFIRGDH